MHMRRWIVIIALAALVTMLFFWVNTGYKMIDMTSLEVRTAPALSVDSVKVQFGWFSINRSNDAELFNGSFRARTIFHGTQMAALKTDYGENDFLVTYADRYYLQFRHFIFNSNHQHDYVLAIERRNDALYLSVDIDGPDAMRFVRPMSLIRDAVQLRCNGPIDNTRVIYNMVEME